jgi:DGQHR domain-containing protein
MAKKKSNGNGETPTPEARPPGDYFDFDCISFNQGTETLAVLAIPAKRLWDLVQINKREEDKDEGYQRALSVARADAIARFIDKGNILPTSILVSFEHAELVSGGRILRVPNRPDAGWVIDGQHRLAGAHRAQTGLEMPVVAILNLDLEGQINCFVTINREQKGVPSSLYYELLKYLPESRNEAELAKELAADMASDLKKDELSPFYARIVTTISPRQGQLSLTNWVRKIAPLIRLGSGSGPGRLSMYPTEDRKGVLNNYYKAISTVFPREFNRLDTIFFKTLGFGALMNVLPFVLDLTIQLHRGFRLPDVVEVFRRIEHFDFSEWHERGSGNAAEVQAAEQLRTELQSIVVADNQQARLRLE